MSTTETNPPDDGVDLLELVGNALEARGITQERMAKLDSLDLTPPDFQAMISDALKGSTTTSTDGGSKFDEGAFMEKIGNLIDGKISGLQATQQGPKPKVLARWLGLTA